MPRILAVRSVLLGVLWLAAFAGSAVAVLAEPSGSTRVYQVPSGSMRPTFRVGQRIVARTDAYRTAGPKRYDVIVFHPPVGADEGRCGNRTEGPGSESPGPKSRRSCSKPVRGISRQLFLKRVIGRPGELVALRHGRAVVNGRALRERYVRLPCGGGPECDLDPIRVRPGTYFVLGDNRGASDDSRYWGPTPRRGLVAHVPSRRPPTPTR